MDLVSRAKNIILKPSQTWVEIKEEKTTISELYTSYAVILAAIPAVAQIIGYSLIGHSAFGVHFRWGIGNALGYAFVSYVFSLIGVYVVAFIANALAPSFGSTKNMLNAFKVALFSMTPVWVSGILYIIPTISILIIIAGLYGIYLFYLGLPVLMDTPKEKIIGYVIVVIVVSFLVHVVIGGIGGAIFVPALI